MPAGTSSSLSDRVGRQYEQEFGRPADASDPQYAEYVKTALPTMMLADKAALTKTQNRWKVADKVAMAASLGVMTAGIGSAFTGGGLASTIGKQALGLGSDFISSKANPDGPASEGFGGGYGGGTNNGSGGSSKMSLWGPAIGMGVSMLGSLFSKKGQQQTTSNNSSTNNSTSTVGPTQLDPQYAGLQNMIMPMIMKRLQSPGGVPRGYEEAGIRSTNRTYDLGKQSLDNNLTARGLGTSPIAGAAGTRLETGRLGSISDFQQSLPMIGRQMQNEDLATAMQNLEFGRSLAGHTVTNTGTNTSTGQATTSQGGGKVSNMIGDMAGMLGWMYGNGMFKGGAKAGAPNTPGFEYF